MSTECSSLYVFNDCWISQSSNNRRCVFFSFFNNRPSTSADASSQEPSMSNYCCHGIDAVQKQILSQSQANSFSSELVMLA